MEASSPLAAMHPTAAPSWGYTSHGTFGAGNLFGAGRSSIRDQLQRAKPDYFNVKNIRGSSPSASLAADLSQNFCLDNELRYVFKLCAMGSIMLTGIARDFLHRVVLFSRRIWWIEVRNVIYSPIRILISTFRSCYDPAPAAVVVSLADTRCYGYFPCTTEADI